LSEISIILTVNSGKLFILFDFTVVACRIVSSLSMIFPMAAI